MSFVVMTDPTYRQIKLLSTMSVASSAMTENHAGPATSVISKDYIAHFT